MPYINELAIASPAVFIVNIKQVRNQKRSSSYNNNDVCPADFAPTNKK